MTQSDLARRIGVKPQSIQAIESGKARGSKHLVSIADALDVSARWLQHGAGPMQAGDRPPTPDVDLVEVAGEDYALLPQLDLRAAAGPGASGTGAVTNRLLFRHDWLRSVTKAPLERLAVIEVVGDSMEPTLRPGDHVLVDLTDNMPGQRDGLFVLSQDHSGLQVKRVSVHPVSRALTIGSDNPAYETYRDISPEEVRFAGRVIWLGRQI